MRTVVLDSDYVDDWIDIARTRQDQFYGQQITQAARGLVTGSLDEWPALRAALKARGHDLPLDTPAGELKQICQDLLELAEPPRQRLSDLLTYPWSARLRRV